MMTTMTARRRGAAIRAGATGFTLIEVLVAAALLGGSLVAVTTLWGMARSITERSRNTAEYYIAARQEAERYRAKGFTSIFDSRDFILNSPVYADYDASGMLLKEGLSAASPITGKAYYRVESTFFMQPTSGEDELQSLGVQQIKVFAIHYENGVGKFDVDANTGQWKVAYKAMQFFAAATV